MEQALFFEDRRHPTATGPHQEAVDGWANLWRNTRGFEFDWTPKELAAVKRGLAKAGSPKEYLERARLLLTNPPSPWYELEASPTLLYSRWNSISSKLQSAKKKAPEVPRCATCLLPIHGSLYYVANGKQCALCHSRQR